MEEEDQGRRLKTLKVEREKGMNKKRKTWRETEKQTCSNREERGRHIQRITKAIANFLCLLYFNTLISALPF